MELFPNSAPTATSQLIKMELEAENSPGSQGIPDWGEDAGKAAGKSRFLYPSQQHSGHATQLWDITSDTFLLYKLLLIVIIALISANNY